MTEMMENMGRKEEKATLFPPFSFPYILLMRHSEQREESPTEQVRLDLLCYFSVKRKVTDDRIVLIFLSIETQIIEWICYFCLAVKLYEL